MVLGDEMALKLALNTESNIAQFASPPQHIRPSTPIAIASTSKRMLGGDASGSDEEDLYGPIPTQTKRRRI
jgi:hypothetical protein